jgi:hypothetical protein
MSRVDRRNKLALDESYRYYKTIEAGESPQIFKLTKSLRTLSTALAFADSGEFKLTRQLWKRLQQALFDRLINTFGGDVRIFDMDGNELLAGGKLPEDGYVQFHPEGCKRADDVVRLELSRVYPKTFKGLQKLWLSGRTRVTPVDFEEIAECGDDGVCLMKPVVVGHDVLNTESQSGKSAAYTKWWELYWQAYCTKNKHERDNIFKHMLEIEAVWGNLYY